MEIHIPTPLRTYTGKQETVSVEGATVAEGLAALVAVHPAMQQHLFTAEGKLRSFRDRRTDDHPVHCRRLLSLAARTPHPTPQSNRTRPTEHLFYGGALGRI
jgi:hypothetical protein